MTNKGWKRDKTFLKRSSAEKRSESWKKRGFKTKITEQTIYGRTTPSGGFKRSMGGVDWPKGLEKKVAKRVWVK
jgi:hypothetical protein